MQDITVHKNMLYLLFGNYACSLTQKMLSNYEDRLVYSKTEMQCLSTIYCHAKGAYTVKFNKSCKKFLHLHFSLMHVTTMNFRIQYSIFSKK